MTSDFPTLTSLRGLRSAPELSVVERSLLRQELQAVMAGCAWFTIGVMAPSAAAAVAGLRQCEAALGWPALEPEGPEPESLQADAAVFLKGNQRNGRFLLRPETGLGQGVLITGHQSADRQSEDTWGPLPLDLFAAA